MAMKVLVTDKLAPQSLKRLQLAGMQALIHLEHSGRLSATEVGRLGGFDAWVVRSGTQVTREAMEAAGQLKIVARAGVGVDNVDVAAATELGIPVINAPAGNSISAAELTFALMAAIARNIIADSNLLAGLREKFGEDTAAWKSAWEGARKQFTGMELAGKSLGLIGLGNIGSLVAWYGISKGMSVLGFDPYVNDRSVVCQKVAALLGSGFDTAMETLISANADRFRLATSLEEVLTGSNFISLHVKKTPATIGMIGKEAFAMMQPGSFIINVSRGGIVNEVDLAEELSRPANERKVALVALDVFDEEPPIESPLISLFGNQVIGTTHLGASTIDAQVKVADDVIDQAIDMLRGGRAKTPVNGLFTARMAVTK